MENNLVILLLSVVVLLIALYGHTVEKNIKEEIKNECVKMVKAEIEHQKKMRKIKDELEEIKSHLQEKDNAYRNEIYQTKQNVTILLKETYTRYDNAFNDFKKEITSKENNTPSAGALRSCDISWGLESCYYFSRFATNFYTALSFCKIIGGKLIEIDDQSEWDMIKRHVQGRRFPDFFIGLTDLFSEGDWQKATTLGRQIFLKWANGQPDNQNKDQHCAQVWVSSMTFDDLNCHRDRHFICEK
ncbi:C-type lectin domain family 4 member E-like [Mytilus edulis]|uniref:C-type lectin domain family 4 member E-like n=1 Tax=Mytilus edulis TaxID=6550 RepID=UPI0039EEA018